MITEEETSSIESCKEAIIKRVEKTRSIASKMSQDRTGIINHSTYTAQLGEVQAEILQIQQSMNSI